MNTMESNDSPLPKKAGLNSKASNKTSPSLQRNPSPKVTHGDEQIPGPSGTQGFNRTKTRAILQRNPSPKVTHEDEQIPGPSGTQGFNRTKTRASLQRNPSHKVTHEDEQIPGPSGTQGFNRTKTRASLQRNPSPKVTHEDEQIPGPSGTQGFNRTKTRASLQRNPSPKVTHEDEQIPGPSGTQGSNRTKTRASLQRNPSPKVTHEDEQIPGPSGTQGFNRTKTWASLQRNPSHNVTHEDEQIPGPSGTQGSERTKSNISSVYKEVHETSRPNSESEGNDSTFTHAGETNHSNDSADNEVKIVKRKSFVTKEPSRDDNLDNTLYCDVCLNLCNPHLDNMYFPNDFELFKTITCENDAPPDNSTLTKQTATCMCFDCNQYLCPNCAHAHSEHFISNVDHSQTKKDETFDTLVNNLKEELGVFDYEEALHVCDIINVFAPSEDTESKCSINEICVLSHAGMWAITDSANCSLKIFNIYNNKLIQYIRFSSPPTDISEVPPKPTPSTMHDGSDKVRKTNYVAVLFSKEEQLLVVDLSNFQANITEILQMPGKCEQVFYCKDKIVTRCNHSIHILSITGEIVHTIDTRCYKLEPDEPWQQYDYLCTHLAVHKETETIYVSFGHYQRVNLVSYDVTGRVLSTFVNFINWLDWDDYRHVDFDGICVDSEQNVYVGTHEYDYSEETLSRNDDEPRAIFTINKLSPDLELDRKALIGYGIVYHFECHKNTFYVCHRWEFCFPTPEVAIMRSEVKAVLGTE